MKNISEKIFKILAGIVIIALLILNSSFFWYILPFVVLFITILISKKEGKCRLYRWIVAGVLFPNGIMSCWGVWRATGNILTGLLSYFIIFSGRLIILYLREIQFFNLKWIYYVVFEIAFELMFTFIVLRWAWKKLPVEVKVYGWK